MRVKLCDGKGREGKGYKVKGRGSHFRCVLREEGKNK